ncbi:putative L-galactonate transporter [Paraburkholderia domus]|jgi:Arabinose efflux permease|uniref:MFS transporter n=1 Tax=Paraburkholderia domus TaxID=2793075 RepID=UPI0019149DD3|nr:MFS transporter [Paraburkholderia domus]MBK5053923.1 MFS transporter [Burkholderia sp. R-70006]MBK5063948.1 MFS transporter [Burkholderia sp. R-70199]MBK5090073.1 MFS transporter [Burkholderia sp. R-69927]MBK5125533.1 MFS transporter [Burkholderia sp. R-69980]MBK5185392.1 MFS transporter [Burkholderia sp. R-69749]MCI0150132.1 MFS transporter [Paraburkholderia sediminicola]
MRALHLIQTRGVSGAGAYQGSKTYAWTVFALSFGLILSDYLSRQAVGAVFPFLKPVWGVSDSQLGALVSVVSLVVGVMTIPLSLIADRWGRVKSITLMAFVWCFATIACGLATSYTQMLVARAMVGFGEAAYAAAGAALLAHTFPENKRSAVLGAFQSGGVFGSVMGVVIGGAVASQFGWRYAFFAVGAPGLLLAVLYPFFVRDYQTPALQQGASGHDVKGRLRFAEVFKNVFAARSGNFTFAAFGLQMGIPAILIAWVPTYFNRFYGYDPKKASMIAAAVVLVLGLGMLFGGGVADRLSRGRPRYRALVPAAYALLSASMLFAAFALPPGVAGLVLLLGGALFAAAHGGAAVAMLIDVTHPAVHATVTATAVLGANLLGTAPGPYLVGLLSDVANLRTALTVAPLMSLAAAVLFLLAARYYEADIAARKAAG